MAAILLTLVYVYVSVSHVKLDWPHSENRIPVACKQSIINRLWKIVLSVFCLLLADIFVYFIFCFTCWYFLIVFRIIVK